MYTSCQTANLFLLLHQNMLLLVFLISTIVKCDLLRIVITLHNANLLSKRSKPRRHPSPIRGKSLFHLVICSFRVSSWVVGKCRFWHSSIFRIGFSFDDVTSNRTVPESASVATTYGVADSGPVLFLESYFGAMTSRRLVAVATTYGVADSGTVLFLELDFGATTSLVSAMVGDISDSGTFWCVPGVRGVSLWYIEPLSRVEYISGDHLITTVSHHPTGGSGAGVIITPSYVKSFQILGDVLTRSWLDDVIT